MPSPDPDGTDDAEAEVSDGVGDNAVEHDGVNSESSKDLMFSVILGRGVLL